MTPRLIAFLLVLSVASAARAQSSRVRPVMGAQKIAVIVAKYSHTPDEFRTFDEIREAVFTGPVSANAWFREASYGKASLVGKLREDGDIFGPVTLPFDDTNCLTDLVRAYDMSLQLARPMGFDVAGYDKVIVNLPNSDVCGERGGGRAEVGLRRIWAHGRASPWVLAHELLHSYGLHHANGLNCRAADNTRLSLGGTCSSGDRGDRTDIMGSASQYKHLGAYLKSLLGWIPPANVRDVVRSGTYTLAPVEAASEGVQNLRIPVGVIDGVESVVDIDHRQPIGFSGSLTLQSYGGSVFQTAALAGVYLRLVPRDPGRYANSSVNLIDVDPSASGFEPLLAGRRFADPAGRFSVEVIAVDGRNATVRIEVSATDAGVPMDAASSPRVDASVARDTSGTSDTPATSPTGTPDALAPVAGGAPDARSRAGDADTGGEPKPSPTTETPPANPGGCGCRTSGEDRSFAMMWLLLPALVLLRRARRRAGSRSGPATDS